MYNPGIQKSDSGKAVVLGKQTAGVFLWQKNDKG